MLIPIFTFTFCMYFIKKNLACSVYQLSFVDIVHHETQLYMLLSIQITQLHYF